MSAEPAEDKYLPKRYSQNFNDTITVLVGLEGTQESFTIHKDLICANSKFFKAACSKIWTEGKEKIVRLPEVREDSFQTYIVWVYSGKVSVNVNESPSSAVDKASVELNETTELYLLGDFLGDLQLRNAAMRTWVLKSKVWDIQPTSSLIKKSMGLNPTWVSVSKNDLRSYYHALRKGCF